MRANSLSATPRSIWAALKNIGLTDLKDALADAIAQVQRAELARQEEAREVAAQWR